MYHSDVRLSGPELQWREWIPIRWDVIARDADLFADELGMTPEQRELLLVAVREWRARQS